MEKENCMHDPNTREVRSAQVPTALADSVRAKNAARQVFTDADREAAEKRLREIAAEL